MITQNLKDRLEKVMSKNAGMQLVKDVENGDLKGETLIEAAIESDERYSIKAAWVLRELSISQPEIFSPYYKSILGKCASTKKDSIVRDLLKVIMTIPIQLAFEGVIIDTAFRQLERMGNAVAVKYYSMSILSAMSEKHPEIAPEVMALLDLQKDLGTKSFKIHASRTIEKLGKLPQNNP